MGHLVAGQSRQYNFDRVEVEFYRDNHVAFEAFKAGEFDFYIENQAKNWANGYDFPALQRGEVLRAEIPHRIPTQTQALFMNTRRPGLRRRAGARGAGPAVRLRVEQPHAV